MQAEVASDPPPDGGYPAADGSRSPDGGARCDALAPLRLYYWNLHTAASSTDINYIVKVENATTAPIATSSLEVRYYFTNELTASATIDVFYADTCCSNKKTNFEDAILTSVRSPPSRPNADAYLSVGFAPAVGPLAVGDAVQVEIAFHEVGYGRSLMQTNDYSYSASAGGTQAQWNACPGPQCETKFTSCALMVYEGGVPVWGTPP